MWRCVATDAGAAKWARMEPIRVTRIDFGDGTIASDAEAAGLTALKHHVQDWNEGGSRVLNGVTYSTGVVQSYGSYGGITMEITNVGVETSFFLREIGIWVADGDAEILFGVSYTTTNPNGYELTYRKEGMIRQTLSFLQSGEENELALYMEGAGVENDSIPQDATKIADRAFSERFDITSADIPDAVGEIGDAAFYSTPLNTLRFNERARYNDHGYDAYLRIGRSAFGSTGITALNLYQNILEIGDGAFAHCENLESVNGYAQSIGIHAFWYCTSLKAVTIETTLDHSGTMTVGRGAFDTVNNELNLDLRGGKLVFASDGIQNQGIFGSWRNWVSSEGQGCSIRRLWLWFDEYDVPEYVFAASPYYLIATDEVHFFHAALSLAQYRLQPALLTIRIASDFLPLYSGGTQTFADYTFFKLERISLMEDAVIGTLRTGELDAARVPKLRNLTASSNCGFQTISDAAFNSNRFTQLYISRGFSANIAANALQNVTVSGIYVYRGQDLSNFPWGAKSLTGGDPTLHYLDS